MLGVSTWALPLAPVQVVVALWTRLHDNSNAAALDTAPLPYYSEQAPLTGRGAMTPEIGAGSDVELGDIGVVPSDPDQLKLALAGTRCLGAAPPSAGADLDISPTARKPTAAGRNRSTCNGDCKFPCAKACPW